MDVVVSGFWRLLCVFSLFLSGGSFLWLVVGLVVGVVDFGFWI